jgi:hypothetical protein
VYFGWVMASRTLCCFMQQPVRAAAGGFGFAAPTHCAGVERLVREFYVSVLFEEILQEFFNDTTAGAYDSRFVNILMIRSNACTFVHPAKYTYDLGDSKVFVGARFFGRCNCGIRYFGILFSNILLCDGVVTLGIGGPIM